LEDESEEGNIKENKKKKARERDKERV